MDPNELVREWRHDGRLLLDWLIAASFPVAAAGWARIGDDPQPYLYIATPKVGVQGFRDGYHTVFEILRSGGKLGLSPFDIKLIPDDDPLATAMADVDRHSESTAATWYRGSFLGNVSIDGAAYIYALKSAPAAP